MCCCYYFTITYVYVHLTDEILLRDSHLWFGLKCTTQCSRSIIQKLNYLGIFLAAFSKQVKIRGQEYQLDLIDTAGQVYLSIYFKHLLFFL